MAANKDRAKRFNQMILDLEQEITFEELYETFRAKLLDRVARGDLTGEEALRTFQRQVERIINPEYTQFVQKSFDAYDEVVTMANTEYSDIGPEVSRQYDRIQAIEQVNLTRLGQYKDATVKEISRRVRRNLSAGNPFQELANEIAGIGGRVSSYAETLARTQVKGYSQAAKTEKARLGEVFFYQYVGIRRAETRVFCLELLDQGNVTFHVDDIRSMRNGQLGSVLTYRGGFNCHHDWEPDPFASREGYSVSFYTVKDQSRTLRLARRS